MTRWKKRIMFLRILSCRARLSKRCSKERNCRIVPLILRITEYCPTMMRKRGKNKEESKRESHLLVTVVLVSPRRR
jgi:hypothetical protein